MAGIPMPEVAKVGSNARAREGEGGVDFVGFAVNVRECSQ
jgi:hypothetical protein